MIWKMICEEYTPSDKEIINKSFNKDVSSEKYTPTMEFVKVVYDKLNKELFYNFLPPTDELRFIVKTLPPDFYGKVVCIKNTNKVDLRPTTFTINNRFKPTIHDWMTVILHEMIHICDYLKNPNNFYNDEYDPYGEWFLKKCEEFKKYGFNVMRYGELDHDMEIDAMEKMKEPNVFILLGKDVDGSCEMIRVSEQDKDVCIDEIRGKYPRRKRVLVLFTYNPESCDFELWKPGDELEFVYLTDDDLKYYGPFLGFSDKDNFVELNESIDEDGHDAIDEYIRIAKNIKGVSIRKIDDENCEISLS